LSLFIERDLTRQLRAGDVATNAWLRDRSWQIAAALRDLKKWISTPMWDTRARLIEELSRSLICAASGDWDGLSRSMPEKLTGSQVRIGLLMIARLLLAGALPALALWGLQSTRFRLQGEIYHYAVFGVSLWGLISLLSAFDPTFSTKASTIADMAKNFLPGKK
jgi:hypothetical protein